MKLIDLKPSISDLSQEEGLELVIERRNSRRQRKPKKKKESKVVNQEELMAFIKTLSPEDAANLFNHMK